MDECVLVHLLKYSIKTIPNDSGITDLDLLVDIEDQPVLLHTTQIILIYTVFVFMCLFIVQNYPTCNFKSFK